MVTVSHFPEARRYLRRWLAKLGRLTGPLETRQFDHIFVLALRLHSRAKVFSRANQEGLEGVYINKDTRKVVGYPVFVWDLPRHGDRKVTLVLDCALDSRFDGNEHSLRELASRVREFAKYAALGWTY